MAEVRWSAGALGDLDPLGRYLKRMAPAYARTLVARLFEASGTLTILPQLGRVVPEVNVARLREIGRDGRRIVHLLANDLIDVLAGLHGRQDLGRALRRGGRT